MTHTRQVGLLQHLIKVSLDKSVATSKRPILYDDGNVDQKMRSALFSILKNFQNAKIEIRVVPNSATESEVPYPNYLV